MNKIAKNRKILYFISNVNNIYMKFDNLINLLAAPKTYKIIPNDNLKRPPKPKADM